MEVKGITEKCESEIGNERNLVAKKMKKRKEKKIILLSVFFFILDIKA